MTNSVSASSFMYYKPAEGGSTSRGSCTYFTDRREFRVPCGQDENGYNLDVLIVETSTGTVDHTHDPAGDISPGGSSKEIRGFMRTPENGEPLPSIELITEPATQTEVLAFLEEQNIRGATFYTR